ncbi:MAG: helix-turn-helix domain-containing protein [Acidobacteriota bacterium]
MLQTLFGLEGALPPVKLSVGSCVVGKTGTRCPSSAVLVKCDVCPLQLAREAERNLNEMLQAISYHARLRWIPKWVEDRQGREGLKITVKEAASLSCLSAPAFFRFFKSKTGLSFHQFLLRLRNALVTRMIESSDQTVTQLAFSSGFDSLKSFNRTFRRLIGCSPTLYRKLLLCRERTCRTSAGQARE